jgi:hypothetical protein
MADLNEIVIHPLAPLIIPDDNIDMIWNDQDQEILEWLFPALREETPPAPRTPDCPEPARLPVVPLRRQNALSPEQWEELLEIC